MPETVAGQRDETMESLLLEKYEPIAIVGIGLRFPGGSDCADSFADFLREGRSGIGPIPADRWDVAAFAPVADADNPADNAGRIRSGRGGFLDRVDRFDAQFFNISPKEAQYMDPQQRLLLETCWEALEHANIDPATLRGGTGGVYVGASSIDYALELDSVPYAELDGHLAAGITFFPLSGRLSYFLGWRGPCMTLDTACASSLTALHQAVIGLRRKECDIALCAGVNALHHPRIPVIFSNANMLAPDGECKTFDESADGYVRAEGCGALVVKRLSDATRDGDTILALVRGSAVGQDGDSVGLTVPNGSAQEAVIRTALRNAALGPADIQYVEAHGTGTPLGDPIEMGAITDVFARSHTKDAPVVVGSVKTNLGHMEPVAGIVGVIKTVLQMRENTIFPHLNFSTPSSRIPWDSCPVTVPTACQPWTAPIKRAVVNSFGFGGTIAVAVLEQAPQVPAPPATPDRPAAPDRPADAGGHVFTLSAKNRRSLKLQIERYQRFLAENPRVRLDELCYTGNVGRAHFPVRMAGVVADREELDALLAKQLAKLDQPAGDAADVRKVAFLFTGQGSQYPGMGAALYARHEVYRDAVDACDRLFADPLGRSIRAMVLGEATDADDIHQTRYTQPALFTVEYALAQLWLSWGVRPGALIGHSIGEVVAATVAGLFALPDAVTLVAARARLMQSVSAPGGMVAVSAPVADIAPLLGEHPDLAVAAVNSPGQCVVSGGSAALAEVTDALRDKGVRTKQLPVSHAFHSPLMAEVSDAFRAALAGIAFREPRLTLISNLTGKVARPAELSTAEYWVRHINEPVNFEAGMRALERRGRHAFVEIGPAPALIALGKQCVNAEDHHWLASLTPTDTDGSTIRRAVAQMYTAGLPVNWTGFHAGARRRRITLPGYAFDRKRYWLPNERGRHGIGRGAAAGPAHHPLLGEEVSTVEQRAAGVREFRAHVGANQPAYLTDHRVGGQAVFPGTGYVEVLLALQDAVYGETGRAIGDVRIREALFLSEERTTEVRTRLRPGPDGTATVEIVSLADGTDGAIERCHATAELAAAPEPAADLSASGAALRAAADAAGEPAAVLRTAEVYAEFSAVGMEYGPQFQRIRSVARHGDDLAVADLRGHADPAEHLPPSIMDGAQHCLVAVVDDDGNNYLPVRFGRFRLFKKPKSEDLRAVLRLNPGGAEGIDLSADIVVLEGDRPVFELCGLGLKRVTDGARRHFFHRLHWTKRSLVGQAGTRAGHVLVLNRDGRDLADLVADAATSGTAMSFADTVDAAAKVLRERPVTDVCWFWRGGDAAPNVPALRAQCERNYRDLLDLLAMLAREGFGRNQRLWLVTEQAQWLPGDPPNAGEHLAAATLWGFGHVLLNEYPSYRVSMVDLPVGGGDRRGLLAEWLAPDAGEYQVAFRDGHRYVRRLRAVDPRAGDPNRRPAGNLGLVVQEYGRFAGIRAVPLADVPPTGDQITVQVCAAGLNFKDVLNALGMLKQLADDTGTDFQPQPLGFECAGTVVACGPDAEFAVGDEVIVNHIDLMRQRATVSSKVAVRKPAGISFPQAAGVASAYVTAYYALHHLAKMKAGDRVLVHAAAGGVGQAAVALAKLAGAEVYATASPHKWPLLRAQGVAHVMNSRTLEFADEIAHATSGAGVDIVLNSLNKDYIPAGMRSLGTGGRFIELGKVGAWTTDEVRAVRPDVEYHNFDLSELPEAELLRLNKEILETVVPLVGAGKLPPLPVTAYTVDEAEEAFGVLSRGANVGKLVFTFTDDDAPPERDVTISPDHTYVITGGLGAFGLVTAGKLVDLGARHLALVSRGAAPAPDAAHLYQRLRDRAEVTVYRADIGDPADMAQLTAALAEGRYPVAGIVHAAGGLADAPVSAQTWERIDGLFQAKVYGTWLLHELAGRCPELDLFFVHASASSVVGGASQSNYAAANAFLDGLLQWRARHGLPAQGVNWGPMAEVGMSARLSDQHVRALEHEGIRFFTPARAMRAMAGVFGRPVTQLVGGECDWDRFVAAKPVANALFKELLREEGGGGTRIDLEALSTLDGKQRRTAIGDFVRAKVAEVLHIEDVDDVAGNVEFVQLGLDSLVAVELKNALESAFRVPLPAGVAFEYPTAQVLAELIDRRLTPEEVA